MISNRYWNYHPDFFLDFGQSDAWKISGDCDWGSGCSKNGLFGFFSWKCWFDLLSLQKCTDLTHFLLKLLNIFKTTLLPNHVIKSAYSRAAVPPQPPEQHVHGAPHNSRSGRSFEFFSKNELLNSTLQKNCGRKSTFHAGQKNPLLWRKKSPGTHFEIRTLKWGLKMRSKIKSGLTSWKSLNPEKWYSSSCSLWTTLGLHWWCYD